MFKTTFKMLGGMMYRVTGDYHYLLLRGDAETRLKYDGLLRPDERAELAAVIAEYDALQPSSKVA